MVGPLFFGVVALSVYRLWEQKIVINFKERGLMDPAARYKVGLIGLTIVGYLLFGWFSGQVSDKRAYTFVVLQPLGAMGLATYKTLSVESHLQGVNWAFKHYQVSSEELEGAQPHGYRDRAAKAIEQAQFVPESCVQYDIMATQAYDTKVLTKKLCAAKSVQNSARIAACEEEEQWLKVLAMWIGRLGNTKETFKTRWGNINGQATRSLSFTLYAHKFVVSEWFDDHLWHKAGSFRGGSSCTACCLTHAEGINTQSSH
ncbi:hypothetical protein PHYPSEUDO_012101 [Phytophthora pseudosyringae]|uniref:Uncharacterized protein n=1 Tax=Phytophthora pseudosyringae TaxID=221518 RepID=A0A8T1W8U5_9STRA|nr:hypothetical protein PHYPSEUDO_012101 [Phytophthora pseudosyringae]